MVVRTLSRDAVEGDPHSVWNAFVDLLANERYDDLAPEQRAAHLVFRYESEIQNGGHLQYFENEDTKHLGVTIESLGMLGAYCHQQLLKDAGDVWLSRNRPHTESVEEFCNAALDGELDPFDQRFWECNPSLMEVLESHLEQRQALFVVVD